MALYLVACVLSVSDAQEFTVYEPHTTHISHYNCWNDALSATPYGYELATWHNDWEYKETVDYLKATLPHQQAWTGVFFTVSPNDPGTGEFRVPSAPTSRVAAGNWKKNRAPISQNIIKQAKDGIRASVKRGDVEGPPLPASQSQQGTRWELNIYKSTHKIFSYDTDWRGKATWDHRSWRSYIPTTGALMFQKDPQESFDCKGRLKFGFSKAALWRKTPHHHVYLHVYNVYRQIPDHGSKYIWQDWYDAINVDCPGGVTATATECRVELFKFLADLNIPVKQVDKFGLNEHDWKNWRQGQDILSAQEEYWNALVDYEYDKGIEKARESRELKRLQMEKMKLLRLKKASAKTHYYKKQKQG
eukprot:824120_1